MKRRPTEWEQLIQDYHRDNNFIRRMKFKWLTPKGDNMAKLPSRSQLMSTEDGPVDATQGHNHKNKKSSNKPIDPMSKKSDKSMNSSSSKTMSPARQVMKAVTSLALNPKMKKPSGDADSIKTKGELQEPGAKDRDGRWKKVAAGKPTNGKTQVNRKFK